MPPVEPDFRPFVCALVGAGPQAEWVLTRAGGAGDRAVRASLWCLRFLCLALAGLLGLALYHRGHGPGQVLAAVALWILLGFTWRLTGWGLRADGVWRVRIQGAAEVTVWTRQRPRRQTATVGPGAVLRVTEERQDLGELGTQRWLALRLHPGGDHAPLYLGFLALSRSPGGPGSEDGAVWAAARALAARLGARCVAEDGADPAR